MRRTVRSSRRVFRASVARLGHALVPSSDAQSAIANRVRRSVPLHSLCSHTQVMTRTLTGTSREQRG